MTLSICDLRVRLGGAIVLDALDLHVQRGEMVAIAGPNGSGKSTLLRAASGLVRHALGSVEINGEPIAAITPRRRAKLTGLLVQSAEVPPMLTVHEHVCLGRHARRKRAFAWGESDASAVTRALEDCGIAHLASRQVAQLSGGERQRTRLATLLAQAPELLLIDEPLTGLDVEHQLSFLELIRELNSARRRTVLCVLHDLGLCARYFDRLVVMHEGTIAADGPPAEVLTPALLRGVFNVEARLWSPAPNEPVLTYRPRNLEPSPAASEQTAPPGEPPVVTTRARLQRPKQSIPSSG